MSFLDHIRRCNNADLAQFEPWFIGRDRAGFIHHDFAADVVAGCGLFGREDGAWRLDAKLDTVAKRTAEMRTSRACGARRNMPSRRRPARRC